MRKIRNYLSISFLRVFFSFFDFTDSFAQYIMWLIHAEGLWFYEAF